MVEAVPAGSGLSQLPTWLVGNHLAIRSLVEPSAFSFLMSATTTCFPALTRRAIAWPIDPAAMTTMTIGQLIRLDGKFRMELCQLFINDASGADKWMQTTIVSSALYRRSRPQPKTNE